MRAFRLVLWGAVVVALFVAGALTVGWLGERDGPTALTQAPLGGAFRLVDNKGQPVTEAVLRGKPSAMMAGYTHCPDVCPTTLMEMAGWIDALGNEADKLRFVFVTVDPERDTAATMNDYVTAFSERIIGLTGAPDAVRAMLRDYKIQFSKVGEGEDYTMDHLASVLLLDADGALVGTISREEKPEIAVAKLRNLVAG